MCVEVLTLFVVPVAYSWLNERALMRKPSDRDADAPAADDREA
jgi:hypothetical protein